MAIEHRSIHRLLLASVLVASKWNDDAFASNTWYAKVTRLRFLARPHGFGSEEGFAQVGGVCQQEINRLEVAVLDMTKWRLMVTPDEYNHALQCLGQAWAELEGIDTSDHCSIGVTHRASAA